MATMNIVTHEDLETFKQSLLESLTNILADRQTAPARRWLKSHEVRRLLTVSPNTLQSLREKGLLPYTKVGGVLYYDYDDIRRMLEGNKINGLEPHMLNSNKLQEALQAETKPKRRSRS